jgi:hypothetical protein
VNEPLDLSVRRLFAFLAVALCMFSLVDGIFPQIQMSLSGGHLLVGNVLIKAVLLSTAVLGCLIHTRAQFAELPIFTWLLCIGFLIADTLYLTSSRGMSLPDVLQSYNGYYVLLLVGPALLAFRGVVPERVITRYTVCILLVCAVIGVAQYLLAKPILYTRSGDGSFSVQSWQFGGEVRAFSLFSSALEFGIFCTLCGALGVSLSRTLPIRGKLLVVLSGVACFATLTRLCYLLFICACTYAWILTFGRKTARGLWQPLVYFVLGIATLLAGLTSFVSGEGTALKDPSSLIDRAVQWAYYYDLLAHATLADRLFGFGIVQNDKVLPLFPMVIDNLPLALVLHIGVVGLILFGTLLIKMWLYLRRKALATQQPFMVAAASLWATLTCAGIFSITFSSFGAVFALAVLCERTQSIYQRQMIRESSNENIDQTLRLQLLGPLNNT